MTPTRGLSKLNEAHSIMVELAEQGHAAAVLGTMASVLGKVEALDNLSDDPLYWRDVIVNLNIVADTVQRKELDDDSLFGDLSEDDWTLADRLLNDEADFDD